ncbi:MAG: hypothetical protein FJW31_08090 [Acidobacteria bacterium]|nr:hypothetical protein [Acidobacteriota bacterium]
MGFLDSLLGGGIDSKLKHLNKLVEDASYDAAEESLLDLRGACAKKYPPGSAVQTRLDLAEVRLRVKYQQFDRADSPARRAHAAAKGLGAKTCCARPPNRSWLPLCAVGVWLRPWNWPSNGSSWPRRTFASGWMC